MYTTTKNHCEVVLESLTGNGATDDQTFASVNILSERLENLKKMHRCFVDIELSEHVQVISKQQMELAVN